MVKRRVDAYGRITFDEGSIVSLKYQGVDPRDVFAKDSDGDNRIEWHNMLCYAWDKMPASLIEPPDLDHSPEEEHARRQQVWLIPDQYLSADVRSYVLGLCTNSNEVERVEDEMSLYESYDLLPVLRVTMFLIAYFREHDIVWGVGRGSSVASYVLFKIGVHKVDSLKYNLDIRDFLRPT